jgi:protein-S-isoprenylcysteine O-methyltransferase Ste14
MKKLIVGLLIAFIMLVSMSNVFASGGGTHTSSLAEPLGYLLFAVCGAMLASVRHWMSKRHSKKDKKPPMTSKMNRTPL